MLKYALIGLLLIGCSKSPQSPFNQIVKEQRIEAQGDGIFGEVNYEDSKIKSFVFKNTDSSPLSLSPSISGSQASSFAIGFTLGCTNLEVNKNCLVKVMFNSLGKTAGNYEAVLNIGSLAIPLSASIAAVPEVKYDIYLSNQKIDESFDLGSLVTNEIKLVSVKVVNNSPMNGNPETLVSGNPFYTIIHNGCNNITLKPNQACYSKMYFKGDAVSENKVGSLQFGNSIKGISVSNQAQQQPASFQASSPVLEMGDFHSSGEKIIKSIILTNGGTGAGSLESLVLPSEYSILHNNCNGVKPGNKCIIKLAYSNPVQDKGRHTDAVSLGDSSIGLTVNQVNKENDLGSIAFTVADNILTNTCSPLVVDLKDKDNLSFVSSKDTELVASQTVYSNSDCSSESTVKIPSFESSKTFYVKSSSAGAVNLSLVKNSISSNKEIYFYDNFSSSELSKVLITGQSYQAIHQGGKAPYSYVIESGVGSLQGNNFLAGEVAGNSVIKIKDSLNHELTLNIQVVLPLSTNVLSFEKLVNQSQSILGQNGLPPYSYAKVSGVGSISSSGSYSAEANAGVVQIKVSDALGQEVMVTGQIYSLLSALPSSISVAISDSQSVTASGGKTPYIYSKVSGVGSISNLGVFSSLDMGVGQIKVQDQMGQEVLIPVSVASNVVVSSGNCSFTTTAEGMNCTPSVTGGVGAKTWSATNGNIDANTGVFYGICSGNVGSSVITAMDSRGNTGSTTISYPCVYKGCSELRAKGLGATSGDYWLDPDGLFRSGSTSPTKIYCDFRADGTWAFMAEKKAADGVYFPSSSINGGEPLGFYTYAGSANGTFSKNMSLFSPLSGIIMLEDGSYNYKISWNGNLATGGFKTISSSGINTKIYTLHSAVSGPAAGSTLSYSLTTDITSRYEDICGVVERNYTNPLGYSSFKALILTTGNWNINGSQSLCPFGLGAHGDLNWDGYAPGWLGANKNAAGTAIKVYYQDIYNHHPTSCQDAKDKGVLNTSGNTGTGTYTIDPDGYLYGTAPVATQCHMDSSSGFAYTQVSTSNINATKILAGKQFVKLTSMYDPYTGVANGVQVVGLFGTADISNNFLVGKASLYTTNAYQNVGGSVGGYNYMGGNNAFVNRQIPAGNINYVVIFGNNVVGKVNISSDGTSHNLEHAYLYYHRYNYTLWERP